MSKLENAQSSTKGIWTKFRNVLDARIIIGAVVFLIALSMFAYAEYIVQRKVAPEMVLVRLPQKVLDKDDTPECSAEVRTEGSFFGNGAVESLTSIYDVLDPHVFATENDQGYYIVHTGLAGYHGEFEMKFTCYSPSDDTYSFIFVNNENTACSFSSNGKVLLC